MFVLLTQQLQNNTFYSCNRNTVEPWHFYLRLLCHQNLILARAHSILTSNAALVAVRRFFHGKTACPGSVWNVWEWVSRVKHKRTNKQQWLITELRLSASDEFIKSPPSKRQICCSTAVISEAVRLCVPVYGHVFASVCLYSLFQCSGLLLWHATAPQTTGLAFVQQRFGVCFFFCSCKRAGKRCF